MHLTLSDIQRKYLPKASIRTVQHWRSKLTDFPPIRKGRKYDVRAVLERLVAGVPKTSVVFRQAKAALDGMTKPKTEQQVEKPQAQPLDAPKNDALDYEAQLVNLRRAASRAFQRWQNLDADLDADSVSVNFALKSYTTTMETLRRMEMDYLDFQKKQGEVLVLSEVQEVVTRLIANTLQKLMQLPSLLAPQLKGLANQARIKKILEDAIRNVVNGLQERPF